MASRVTVLSGPSPEPTERTSWNRRRHVVLRDIGRGMGVVWLCRDKVLGLSQNWQHLSNIGSGRFTANASPPPAGQYPVDLVLYGADRMPKETVSVGSQGIGGRRVDAATTSAARVLPETHGHRGHPGALNKGFSPSAPGGQLLV